MLQLWDQLDAFHEQEKRTRGMPEYVFYDGPPFATGLPHYGHILAGTIKDVVTRYATTTGHHVVRRFGWDCHGLPVEYEIDQKLGIKSKDDVYEMGIDKYNEECRSIVMRYSKEWEKTIKRVGRWIDFENDYKTLDPTFMESVWWVFQQLFQKGLVYKGFKVMPYSTACCTPLSNFEAGQNYKDVSDPAVMVSFPIVGDPENASFVAWTTTPWTLPSNLALCVNPEFTYVRVRDPAKGNIYVVAEARLSAIPGAVPKKKGKKDAGDGPAGFEILAKVKGTELAGTRYAPLFGYYAHLKTAFRVVADGYVTDDSGTGVVHCAPAFGEDDYRVCLQGGIIEKGGELPNPVDDSGRFTQQVSDFAGRQVKEADKDIIAMLKTMERLVDSASIVHSYPFCWRSDTPLIYKAVPSWFVKVETIKERLLKNNSETYWVPNFVKEKRFHNWLENAHDWAVSRSRFWGTPIPIWASEDGEEIVCIGSVAELEELSGQKVCDLHRHYVDHITIPSKQGKGELRRVEDVFDCWFESGSMPYAQQHYPFENKEFFESNFPADFIAEGLDQTRGWFYTLMVLSTALFDKPPFKNLICNGLVLAADGKKMSKRLKNYPDPVELIHDIGADALRLYLCNSPVVRAEPLRFQRKGVSDVVKDVFLPWYNAYRFLVQNALRLEAAGLKPFNINDVDLSKVSNVLDRWILISSNSLVEFVRQEMDGYRLYTVMPYLVKFIDSLTNVYVRYNRKRLKGKTDDADCRASLATLYSVIMTLCKVMTPFTPFFVESMFQNLRRCKPDEPESVHFCSFPVATPSTEMEKRIELSVNRMQKVIELARIIRDRHAKPVKTPLRELTVVHPDDDFLSDLVGDLKEYVTEEINVRTISSCNDPSKFANVRAEPDWASLGKRLGKDMGRVAKAVKGMGESDISMFESSGSISLEGHVLCTGDIKVVRDFKQPAGTSSEEIDAAGDGDVLVVLDLVPDESLVMAGLAREMVNRIQKMRKAAGLTITDRVDVYHEQLKEGPLDAIISSQREYLEASLGTSVRPFSAKAANVEPLAVEEHVIADVIHAKFILTAASKDGTFATTLESEVSKLNMDTC